MNDSYPNFTHTRKSLAELDIDKVEASLGITLPEHVRSHYLMFNGGEPERCILECDGEEYVVQEFFPMRCGPREDRLESVCSDLHERGVLPKHLVPFADDPGGDFFCFSLDPDHIGAIYLYRTDVSTPESAVRYLSDSLKTFMNRLRIDE